MPNSLKFVPFIYLYHHTTYKIDTNLKFGRRHVRHLTLKMLSEHFVLNEQQTAILVSYFIRSQNKKRNWEKIKLCFPSFSFIQNSLSRLFLSNFFICFNNFWSFLSVSITIEPQESCFSFEPMVAKLWKAQEIVLYVIAYCDFLMRLIFKINWNNLPHLPLLFFASNFAWKCKTVNANLAIVSANPSS